MPKSKSSLLTFFQKKEDRNPNAAPVSQQRQAVAAPALQPPVNNDIVDLTGDDGDDETNKVKPHALQRRHAVAAPAFRAALQPPVNNDVVDLTVNDEETNPALHQRQAVAAPALCQEIIEDNVVDDELVEGKASSTAVASRASSKRNHHDEDSLAMVQSASSKCRKLSSTAAASSVTVSMEAACGQNCRNCGVKKSSKCFHKGKKQCKDCLKEKRKVREDELKVSMEAAGGQNCSNCGVKKSSECFYPGEKQCKDCKKEKADKLAVEYEEARKGQVVCSEKECTNCGHTRTIEYFDRDRTTKTGLLSQCIMCRFIPKMIYEAERRNQKRIDEGREMPEVTVTPDYISGLPTTCALSGVELVFCSGHIHKASLDRISDTDGYVDGNVRLVDTRFNTRAKWTLEKYQEAFGSGWKQFVETRGKSMKSKSPETEIHGFTLREKFHSLAAKEGRSMEMISDMWDRQGGRCYYSNIPMSWGHIDVDDWTVSVERLNQGSYTPDNTVLVCAEFNSQEYMTDRFAHLFDGQPQGWNQAVVNWYRTRE